MIRNKFISFISISSLAIGFACFLIIILYIKNELSYEHSFPSYNNIYRVGWETVLNGIKSKTPYSNAVIAETMMQQFPEVVSATRVYYESEEQLNIDKQLFNEDYFYYADSTFFNVFDIEFILGDKEKCLSEPNSVVITESIANRYFKDKNPIGKIIKNKEKRNFQITAICNDFPKNSHLKFNFLASYNTHELSRSHHWPNNYNFTYILLSDNTNYKSLEKELNKITAQEMSPILQRMMGVTYDEFLENGNIYTYFFQPITDIHLYSDLEKDMPGNSNIQYVIIFLIIGAFIFIVSILNFMNLITAQSMTRSKEIGIRKVSGAKRKQIIIQFLSESGIYVFFGFLFGLVILETVIPFINRYYDQSLVINYFNPIWILPAIFIALIIITILSGSYNAIVQSRLMPVDAIKEKQNKFRGNFAKYGFVLLQFVISIFFIISSLFVQKQLNYMYSKDLGFDKKDILVLEGVDVLENRQQLFKNELLKLNKVQNASYSNCAPGIEQVGTFTYKKGELKENVITVAYTAVDTNFIETYGINAYKSPDMLINKKMQPEDIFVNEATLKQFNITDIESERLVISGSNYEFQITGIIKDFNYEPLFKQVTPYVLVVRDWPKNILSIKLKGHDHNQTVEAIEKIFKNLSGAQTMDYFFVEEHFKSFYKNERLTKSLFILFSIIVVFIAVFGLLGLTSFTFQQKVKEIGIRKTFGADKFQIFTLLTKRMGYLIGVSNLIAWPLAYLFVKNWLQNFAYRIEISIWYFVVSALISYSILLITIVFITQKVVNNNPIESLRYE